MATVCSSSATKVVSQNGVYPCVQSPSSSHVERIAFPSSCKLPGLRIGSQNAKLKKDALVVRMGIRAVESFDATFQLTPESDQLLRSMLVSESFNKQVTRDCALGEDVKPEFSGEVFQPVPWSQTTKHGMLPEYEKYYHDSENYVIVNVPHKLCLKRRFSSHQGCVQSSRRCHPQRRKHSVGKETLLPGRQSLVRSLPSHRSFWGRF